MEFEFKGLEKLMKKFDELPQKLKDQVQKEALMESGVLVKDTAKELAPVAQKGGGQLRDSISMKMEKEDEVKVYSNVAHAVFNEFGTGQFGDPRVPHTTKEYWTYMGDDGNFYTTKGMHPQPFMQPAIQDNIDNIKQIHINKIKEAVKGD